MYFFVFFKCRGSGGGGGGEGIIVNGPTNDNNIFLLSGFSVAVPRLPLVENWFKNSCPTSTNKDSSTNAKDSMNNYKLYRYNLLSLAQT